MFVQCQAAFELPARRKRVDYVLLLNYPRGQCVSGIALLHWHPGLEYGRSAIQFGRHIVHGDTRFGVSGIQRSLVSV